MGRILHSPGNSRHNSREVKVMDIYEFPSKIKHMLIQGACEINRLTRHSRTSAVASQIFDERRDRQTLELFAQYFVSGTHAHLVFFVVVVGAR